MANGMQQKQRCLGHGPVSCTRKKIRVFTKTTLHTCNYLTYIE